MKKTIYFTGTLILLLILYYLFTTHLWYVYIALGILLLITLFQDRLPKSLKILDNIFSTLIVLIVIIILAFVMSNLPIVTYEEKITGWNSNHELNANYSYLENLLGRLEEYRSKEIIKDIKEEIKSREIDNLLMDTRELREKINEIILDGNIEYEIISNQNSIINMKNLDFYLDMELYLVKEKVIDGDIEEGQERIIELLEMINNVFLSKSSILTHHLLFVYLEEISNFYLINRSLFDNQLDFFGKIDEIGKNINRASEDALTVLALNLKDEFTKKAINIRGNRGRRDDYLKYLPKNALWLAYNEARTFAKLEQYYIENIELIKGEYYKNEKKVLALRNTNVMTSKDWFINPVGNLMLTKGNADLSNYYYKKERLLSKLEAIKYSLIENKQNLPEDRLTGEKFLVVEDGQERYLKSKYSKNGKEVISIKL